MMVVQITAPLHMLNDLQTHGLKLLFDKEWCERVGLTVELPDIERRHWQDAAAVAGEATRRMLLLNYETRIRGLKASKEIPPGDVPRGNCGS
jgi:hypothetical protein